MREVLTAVALLSVLAVFLAMRGHPTRDPLAETLYITAGYCLVFPTYTIEPCSRYRRER